MFQNKRRFPTSPSRLPATNPSSKARKYADPKPAATTRGIDGGKTGSDEENREGDAGLKADAPKSQPGVKRAKN